MQSLTSALGSKLVDSSTRPLLCSQALCALNINGCIGLQWLKIESEVLSRWVHMIDDSIFSMSSGVMDFANALQCLCFETHAQLCSVNLAGCRYLRLFELPSVEHLQDFVCSGVTVALDAPAPPSALRLNVRSGSMLVDKAASFGFRYWGNISRDELHLSLFDM